MDNVLNLSLAQLVFVLIHTNQILNPEEKKNKIEKTDDENSRERRYLKKKKRKKILMCQKDGLGEKVIKSTCSKQEIYFFLSFLPH